MNETGVDYENKIHHLKDMKWIRLWIMWGGTWDLMKEWIVEKGWKKGRKGELRNFKLMTSNENKMKSIFFIFWDNTFLGGNLVRQWALIIIVQLNYEFFVEIFKFRYGRTMSDANFLCYGTFGLLTKDRWRTFLAYF